MTQIDEGPESPGTHPGLLIVGSSHTGEVLAERYELAEHIGDDAWGRQVWRGTDVVLRRAVAVVLRYPGGDSASEMLGAAVATSRIMHPHLVGVYDAIDEGGRAYVVREWVDGSSLGELVADAPLDPARATSVARATCEAVAALHSTGIAHGNIKPGTVLVRSDGRVILTDARADEAATKDADVRAIGAVLYAALTGRWPHSEAGPTRLPDAVRDPSGRLVAPRQIRGGLPDGLSDLTSDLLNPDRTLPSAESLALELARLDSANDDPLFGGDSPLDFGESGPAPSRAAGGKLAVGVIGLLVIALVGLLIGTRWLGGGDKGNDNAQANGPAPTTAASQHPTSSGQPTPIQLAANQVRVVDPPKSDRTELDGAGKVVDGDPNTGWKPAHYTTANFGNNKPGMGILIDLGTSRKISSVKVVMGTPGATVSLRTGATDPGATSDGDAQIASSYTQIGGQRNDSGSTLSFPVDQQVRYLLVWVSQLAEDQPGDQYPYGVQINEVTVLAQ